MLSWSFLSRICQKTTQTAGKRIVNLNAISHTQQRGEERKE